MSITYLDLSNYKNKLQLDREDHLAESVMPLTDKQKLSLYKKSQKSGYSTDILEEVYRRGHLIWKPELFEGTREQFAFDRVNSFISGGFAVDLDSDLLEKEVWDKPNPKQAAGKSEKLSAAGKAKAKARAKAAGRPYPNMVDNIWAARNEEYTGAEIVSKDKNQSSSRFIGTKSLSDVYKKDTPGQEVKENTISVIKSIVSETIYESKTDKLFAEEIVTTGERSSGPHGPLFRGRAAVKNASFNYGNNGQIDSYVERKNKSSGDITSSSETVQKNPMDTYTSSIRATSNPKKPGEYKNMSSNQTSSVNIVRENSAYDITKRVVSDALKEATYKGKTVPLNKPMKGDVKKSKVYVDPDGDGKAQKVNFGDKNMSIKKNQPGRKKSYCARSGGQGNLTNKTSANYWSRRAWDC